MPNGAHQWRLVDNMSRGAKLKRAQSQRLLVLEVEMLVAWKHANMACVGSQDCQEISRGGYGELLNGLVV